MASGKKFTLDRQLLYTWKTVGACDSIKMELTRDQDVDLWSFYIQKKGERYAVPLKNGSPQEIRINPDFNELLAYG